MNQVFYLRALCRNCISDSGKDFDYLDNHVIIFYAPNGIPPSAQNLEKLFISDDEKLIKIIKEIFKK
ncbi:MAG: hypothetical protein M1479_07905 [Actinobacteria bacterium]|nr:hypothetical protein [Actinomycetota bacterium]